MTVPAEIDLAVARIKDWLCRSGQTKAAIAATIGVDEKSVRQAVAEGWNPTIGTLRKFETMLPRGWRAGDPIPSAKPRPRKPTRRRAA